MVITDSNHKSSSQLQWNTTYLSDSDNENFPWNELETEYTIHATVTGADPPPSGRGLVLLAHNRWSRRKLRTKHGSHERWIANTYKLTDGTLSVLLWYGRPSVSHHSFHSERQEVIEYIQYCHHKNESVLLLVDFNLSYNSPTHHLHPTPKTLHSVPFSQKGA